MYDKNLTENFRLRICDKDMDFLKDLADERNITVSELVRSIISEYRRSYQAIEVLNNACHVIKIGGLSDGDTKTDFDDKL